MDKRYSAYNQRNIYQKITGKRGLLLSLDALDFVDPDGYPAPHMKLRCYEYDAQQSDGAKVTGQVDTFLPLQTFFRFTHGVLQGEYLRSRQTGHGASQDSPPPPFFEYFSGTQGSPPIAKRLRLIAGPGETDDFAVLATSGMGEVGPNGMVLPVQGAKLTNSIYIRMSHDDLCEMCMMGQFYAQEYISSDLPRRLRIIQSCRQWPGDGGEGST